MYDECLYCELVRYSNPYFGYNIVYTRLQLLVR